MPCVAGVVHDDDGRLLLIRRASPPEAGVWTVPGGRVQPRESDVDAVRREVLEEAGLHVVVGVLLGTVVRPAPDGGFYDIRDYACSVAVPGTTPVAGDDAREARWVTRADLSTLDQSPGLSRGLVDYLVDWGMLPH